MARNKYPEITVDKILEVSQRLFLEKGYERTTIQNIVDELDGLTKGAVYHHFKLKEDIMDAVGTKMFFENNPFEVVKKRKDLNGLEKMRLAITLNQADETQIELSKQASPLLNNPTVLVKRLEANRQILCPYWLSLIEEGVEDGSIQTNYAKELSEFLALIDIWFTASIFPGEQSEAQGKFIFLKEVLEKMGLPLYDDHLSQLMDNLPYFSKE